MAVSRTELGPILLQLKIRLMDVLSWPAERVLLMDPDQSAYHHQADQYLLLWPDSSSPDLPILEGAGRVDARASERIMVVLRTRLSLDEATSKQLWLTDATGLGHLHTRHLIWDALINFQVTDADTEEGDDPDEANWLIVAPVTPAGGQRPRSGKLDAKDWGETTQFFGLTYVLDLDQDYQ